MTNISTFTRRKSIKLGTVVTYVKGLPLCKSHVPLIICSRRGVVVITTAQLHSTKPELRFCTGSNPAHGISEIRDGEDL